VRLLNPAAGGVAWVNYTKELAAQPDHWYIGQMENESNPAAHIENTGPEIWSQANGQVDCSGRCRVDVG
jgi:cysteine synthase